MVLLPWVKELDQISSAIQISCSDRDEFGVSGFWFLVKIPLKYLYKIKIIQIHIGLYHIFDLKSDAFKCIDVFLIVMYFIKY